MAPGGCLTVLNWPLFPGPYTHLGRQPLGRNMAFTDGSTGAGELTLRSRKIKRSPFLVLAAGLLLFAAVIGVCLLAMRPATLRIAVGPAGSEDHNLVQALVQTFASDRSPIRL